jgi:histone-lysine N-methyltransferase SETMAR
LKWVPHFLDDDLRGKRLDGARQFLDVLQAQERYHFRDLITGDKIWVYFDMKPGTIWLPADVKPRVGVKRTIANEKRMLIVFWGIHGIAHYCWLPKESTFDSPFFWKEVLIFLAPKMQPNSKQTRKRLTLIHPDNARVYTPSAAQEKLDVSPFKCTLQPLYSPNIAPSDFFSVG